MTQEFDKSRLKSCGVDVRIAPSVVIRCPELVSIGDHCAIDDFVLITTALTLGDYIHIGPGVSIIGSRHATCTMDHFGAITAGCRLVCGSDDYLGSGMIGACIPDAYHADVTYGTIRIGRHVVLGTNTVVHPGVAIGDGVATGSLTLVTRDLAPWHVYTGIPARMHKVRPSARILDAERRLRHDLYGDTRL